MNAYITIQAVNEPNWGGSYAALEMTAYPNRATAEKISPGERVLVIPLDVLKKQDKGFKCSVMPYIPHKTKQADAYILKHRAWLNKVCDALGHQRFMTSAEWITWHKKQERQEGK